LDFEDLDYLGAEPSPIALNFGNSSFGNQTPANLESLLKSSHQRAKEISSSGTLGFKKGISDLFNSS
jgi:hypothetical protein